MNGERANKLTGHRLMMEHGTSLVTYAGNTGQAAAREHDY